MAYSTFCVFNYPVQPPLLLFIFFGTLCSYNFHWFLTPSLASGNTKAEWSYRNRWIHAFLFLAGLIGAGCFALQLSQYWHWLLLTAFFTFLYSAPKIPLVPFKALQKIAVGKTVFLALAWTHIPFMLPLLLSTKDWTTAEYLFVFNRFYLIYAICIVFDYRDREADRQEGIRSMITHFSTERINILFWASQTVFAISGAILYWQGFSEVQASSILLPGIILASTYNASKKKNSDYHYYFFLDGLMALSSLLLLLFQ